MIPDRTTFTAVCARLRCYGPGIREGADVIEHLMAEVDRCCWARRVVRFFRRRA